MHITTSSHVLNKDVHFILLSFKVWAKVFPSVYQNYLHYSSIHLLHRKTNWLKDFLIIAVAYAHISNH
jgi:hypothetical protein